MEVAAHLGLEVRVVDAHVNDFHKLHLSGQFLQLLLWAAEKIMNYVKAPLCVDGHGRVTFNVVMRR